MHSGKVYNTIELITTYRYNIFSYKYPTKVYTNFPLKFANIKCILIVDTIYNLFLKGRGNMQTKIKKWGNSLALRIPKLFANNANLKINKTVEISIDEGSIIITPINEKEYSLEKLLKGISKNNLHGEIGTGAPVGKEIW